ncbi:hypothetical protein ACR79P_17270 [Sphingobacterium spiritivorum]|uniref:Uncharacterized protein n=1 Tax=Sphingobacterium spiritivorum ATCC 33861 TaxID=525373 RepID=D7VQ54_SPHSI|nr:hypothetical protein [Sphingobacterium spiritivorum]EFK55905.1 hypothetical protein HMPREF0766_13108 [Sphingobacterium spiritivorum ATCC 33861]QQT35958.1 hypothetical protein I6J01_00615 [Sphingobacterium spiritivorum]WQD32687.1 hypothetical protein U0038_14315 [Sphingobacterium spiritivorum]SUJ13831.1 Uncharacterised protein [Sphingobacterium spiritivorum]
MKKYCIYIASDSNRHHLEVNLTQDVETTYQEMRTVHASLFNQVIKLSSIVYIEYADTFEQAEKRRKELASLPRIVKERMVRKQNPNWKNLCSLHMPLTILHNKKAVAYLS